MPFETFTPRILLVTPEITYLPHCMGNFAGYFSAKAGGLGDISAGLYEYLCASGLEVHLAIPHYDSIFCKNLPEYLKNTFPMIKKGLCENRIHFVEDDAFRNLTRVYTADGLENTKLSLRFQREVIQRIIPDVAPDLIHCHDWMTSLIPAVAKKAGIPCLLTIHNIHTVKSTLAFMESFGLDPQPFWDFLYFERMPHHYPESRETNPVEYLTSGIFAADFVNTVSQTFLQEIVEERHDFIEDTICRELKIKWEQGRASGITNAPDPSFDPAVDPSLFRNYSAETHAEGKKENKRALQYGLGLEENISAPLLFWPSRLDPIQKGCDLMAQILDKVVEKHWETGLEIIFVADGAYQENIQNIIGNNHLGKRVSIRNFDEKLTRLAYGAADFVIMPSRYEPCGLPQMIGAIYGVLPIAYDTGGIHDTVEQLDMKKNTGNGFLFGNYHLKGLFSAINRALKFYALPPEKKHPQIRRIMQQSRENFNLAEMGKTYLDLYEKLLGGSGNLLRSA